MTPAEELTAAADKLDALVAGASDGPWAVDSHLDMLDPPRTWHLEGIERWRGLTNNVQLGEDEGTARYIAAMNPLVGKAMVEMLREEAAEARLYRGRRPDHLSRHALRFARLINE